MKCHYYGKYKLKSETHKESFTQLQNNTRKKNRKLMHNLCYVPQKKRKLILSCLINIRFHIHIGFVKLAFLFKFGLIFIYKRNQMFLATFSN